MRTILAPGTEIHEVDLSFYDFPQPREETLNVLVTGFAPKGHNNYPYEFTNKNTDDDLIATFGTPTTEAERYFFNTCSEAIKREKTVLYAARLPYYNAATNNYNAVKYTLATSVNTLSTTSDVSSLALSNDLTSKIVAADPTLSNSYSMSISAVSEMPLLAENVEKYRSQELMPDDGTFIIIDKNQEIYEKIPADAHHMEVSSRYFLGLLPVVTTAPNAMYFLQVINANEEALSNFEPVGSLSSFGNEIVSGMMVYPACSKDLPDGNKEAMTLSKYASNFFPSIFSREDGTLDRDRLMNIGVVVFKGWVDAESGNKIKYEPVEAFAGSLKSDDVDPVTGSSRFIDDIVNTNSKTIELYSNCFNKEEYDADAAYLASIFSPLDDSSDVHALATRINDIIDASNLDIEKVDADAAADVADVAEATESIAEAAGIAAEIDDLEVVLEVLNKCLGILKVAGSGKKVKYGDIGFMIADRMPSFVLGFPEIAAADKTITFGNITQSLDKIFEKNKDINEKQIDLVVDAGVANIAQFIWTVNGNHDSTSEAAWLSSYDLTAYKKIDENTSRSASKEFDICTRVGDGSASVKKEQATDKWALILKKYDQFCKTRGDCMFLADGLRPFCVKGQKKRVSKTNFNSTVSKTLTPFIKWMSGKIDTSYGTGNCDWYQITDPISEVNMWMPPSTKTMCAMLDNFNRKYFWTAPAGVNTGRMNPIDNPSKVIVKDIAFSPTVQEAGDIYTKCWNYATYYQDEGFVLEGQRTFQSRATAFDRVNVRRVFLYLERKTALAAKYFLYEGNTAYTRLRFVDTITPFFEDCKIKGGIADFRIQCDEKNNTPDTIDRNELHVKVAIKPTKAIEFIEITFVCLRTGASWSEAGM